MALFNSLKKKQDKEKSKQEKIKTLENTVIASVDAEVVQRYGSAVKEHIVAYEGVDNEAGKVLKKSLKGIANEKVNPDYVQQNIKQQAGFSAEVKETARENAERIINKDTTRVTRTDDIGRVNDPLYDHVEIDAQGNVIEGSGSQMKFVGSSPEAALDRLASHKFEKYLDADAKIEVPSDFYDGIKEEAQKKIKKLEDQIKVLKEQGKNDIASQRQLELEKYQKINRNLEKSHVSNKEAIEARTNPKLSTAKDVLNNSHQAGLEAAGIGAAISGGMSLVRNVVAIAKGEKEADAAVLTIVVDTGTGAAVSYGTAFAGAVIKGGMQNAGNITIRSLSKTNAPALIVTTAIETGKTLAKYARGEIDGVQCITELGEKGTGITGGAVGSVVGAAAVKAAFGKSLTVVFGSIGQVVIPVPIIGSMIGSTVGYLLGTFCYKNLLETAQIFKEAKVARKERIRIEKECEEAITLIRQYRKEMEQIVSRYMIDHIETFHNSFDTIKQSLELGDIDGFITGTNAISKKLGKKVQFDTFNEFNSLMENHVALKL